MRLPNSAKLTGPIGETARADGYQDTAIRPTADATLEMMMKKILAAIAALAMVATVTVAASTDANAQRHWGPALGLGILGGIVVGSIIANRYGPQYVAEPGWEPYPMYRAAGPVDCPGGYWARREFVDQWGNVRASRPRFFCPEGY
jgi:hypothetical protein